MTTSNPRYICIGKGACGSVWALQGNSESSPAAEPVVIKREDGGSERSLCNDYNVHKLILESIHANPPSPSTPLSIPKCHALVQETDAAFWNPRLYHFPPNFTACRALVSERIPPIPRTISDKLVDLFCAGNKPLSDFVKTNPDDDACLIRVYLGRRRRPHQKNDMATRSSRFQRFSLRNVPLLVDQMELLGLNTVAYAQTMAEALATMYWGARVDANDVEFVLAPPRGEQDASSSSEPVFQSEYLGPHCMWLFDFDCCRTLFMDEEGMKSACEAFFRNDPYYPRPGTGDADDEKLWGVFRNRFLRVSREILERTGDDKLVWLSENVMDRIEEEGRARQRRKEELLTSSSS